MRQIKIAALNIAMHQPHSPARYVDLFQQAYRSRIMVRLGKLHGAMLGSLYLGTARSRIGTPMEISGDIYRFVKLDPSQPWFNTETKDLASNQDVQQIAIPKHLLPHLQRLPFVFRPREHQLLFITQDREDRMGPQTAELFFQRLFDFVLTRKPFPTVEVTPIVDRDALEEMLSIQMLEKLTIQLKRPNPDDLGSEHAKWMKKLERMNAQKATTELTAVKGESLQPDAETRAFAHVAANNGKVTVTGRDAKGDKIEESTAAKPLIIREHVDDNVETTLQVLQRTHL